MKDFNQISAFISVVEHGSFSKAAASLNLPKSTLSHRVQELERHLGVTLLKRTTRQLHLTPAGESYYRKSSTLMRELDRVEEETKADQSEPQGCLKFTAPLESASGIMSPLLSEFSNMYPKIDLYVDLTDRRVDLVKEGYDIALRAGVLSDSSLIAKPVGQSELGLYAAPSYLKKNPAPTRPEQVEQHKCLEFAPDNRTMAWKMVSGTSRKEIRPPAKVRCNSFQMILMMATLGQGIALLPRAMATPGLEQGKLVRVLPAWNSGRSPVTLVYPPLTYRSRRLDAFLQFMVPKLREVSW